MDRAGKISRATALRAVALYAFPPVLSLAIPVYSIYMNGLDGIATNVTNIASHGASSAWLLIGNFLVLFIITLLMIGFSYKTGRGGIISLLVAFYAGYALYMVFPYTKDIIGAGSSVLIKA